MTVVSDTSPLNYLVLIDHQEILPDHILIPEAVWHEFRSARRIDCQDLAEELAPQEVGWSATPPRLHRGRG